MYYDYFGLNQPPFRITPDTSLFFPGGNRGAILEALMYAISSGEGIVKVVGEVGSGKTMLCRMLAVELPENIEVVYLANPSLLPENIPHAIAFELKLDVSPDEDRLKVMHKLQDYLLRKHAENHQVVVFVEEAQSMPLATLEEIRLLSNLETHQHKLLQIVLFGQPELDTMISTREIRQLKERITYSFNLNPLKTDEISDYLKTRLRACAKNYYTGDIFTPAAVREISQYSRGLLRRTNILADKSLLAAYADNTHEVTAKHVHIAARDSEFVPKWQKMRPYLIYALPVALLVLGIFFFPNNLTSNEGSAAARNTGAELPKKQEKQEVNTVYWPQDKSMFSDYFTHAQQDPDAIVTLYQQQDTSHYYDYFSASGAVGTGLAPSAGYARADQTKTIAQLLSIDALNLENNLSGSSRISDTLQAWVNTKLN